MNPKQLPDILTETQALASIPEDQFEAALATVISDLQAFIAAVVPSQLEPTITGVVSTVTFSDGSTQTFPVPANG